MHPMADISRLPEERVSLMTAKIGEYPRVLNARWHRLG
jgi:hypothetical protein